VAEARVYLSRTLKAGTPLFEAYLRHLLETFISMGDSSHLENSRHPDIESTAEEMALLLQPLSLLISNNLSTQGVEDTEQFPALQRDAWYNTVVHGFSLQSSLGKKYLHDLGVLAFHSHALIAEERADKSESDIELNTVIRRGMNAENAAIQKKELAELLPQCSMDIRTLNYPELMFLKASHLVETLRALNGDCTKVLTYFVDPFFRNNALGRCMAAVALGAVDSYMIKTVTGRYEAFSAPYAAQQLSSVLESCCHRVHRVQEVAYLCAERIISHVPSALCHRTSIFALLDLLTIMWRSCLEADTDEYEWQSTYTLGTTRVQLGDNYDFRSYTLKNFHRHAQHWIMKAINLAPLDIKGLLQVSIVPGNYAGVVLPF